MPTEAPLRHAHHVPRVDEDGEIGLDRRGPERLVRRIVELADADVAADLDAAQAFGGDALELARGEVGILQRDRAQAHEAARMALHARGDVGVEEAAELERVGRRRAVREEHRHGREHLNVDAVPIHVAQASVVVPEVRLHGTEEAPVARHVGAAQRHVGMVGAVVPHHHPAARAGLACHVRQVARQDVRVDVDGQGAVRHVHGAGS